DAIQDPCRPQGRSCWSDEEPPPRQSSWLTLRNAMATAVALHQGNKVRFRSSLLALVVLCVGGLASICHAAEPRDIGKAVEIQNEVTAAQPSEAKRRLARQSPVREHEAVEAALNSRGEFVLTDDTKLVLGPGARLVLDEFTYVPNQRAASKVIVNFALGAFRFITGSSSPEAYEIKTPAATVGIRGT